MGMFIGIKEGSWSLRSNKDSRWNCYGRGTVGGLIMPIECKEKIEELKLTLGEPPSDLTWGYMKD